MKPELSSDFAVTFAVLQNEIRHLPSSWQREPCSNSNSGPSYKWGTALSVFLYLLLSSFSSHCTYNLKWITCFSRVCWDQRQIESCAEQEMPVPLHITLNLVSVGLISWDRSLCVLLFLPLCAVIWRLDHIICICIIQLPFAFSFLCVICSSGCSGDTVSRTAVVACTTLRIVDVGLVCFILTRATAQQPQNISQPSSSSHWLLCQCDWSDLCSEWEIGSNSTCSKVGRGLGSCCSNPESIQNEEKGDFSFPKRLLEIPVEGWAVPVLLTLLLAYLCTAEVVTF